MLSFSCNDVHEAQDLNQPVNFISICICTGIYHCQEGIIALQVNCSSCRFFYYQL